MRRRHVLAAGVTLSTLLAGCSSITSADETSEVDEPILQEVVVSNDLPDGVEFMLEAVRNEGDLLHKDLHELGGGESQTFGQGWSTQAGVFSVVVHCTTTNTYELATVSTMDSSTHSDADVRVTIKINAEGEMTHEVGELQGGSDSRTTP